VLLFGKTCPLSLMIAWGSGTIELYLKRHKNQHLFFRHS